MLQEIELVVLGIHIELGNLGIPEGKLTDVLHIRANGHRLQGLTFIEHTLGQDGCIDIEGFQRLAAGEGIGAVFHLFGGNGHILQALTAGKRVFTDGFK